MGSSLRVMGLPASGRNYRETGLTWGCRPAAGISGERVNGAGLQRAQRTLADVRVGDAVVR